MPTYTTQLDLLRAVATGDLNTDTINVTGTVTATPTGTQDVNITKYGGTSTTLGQKASTASIPTVLASDQSAIPVSQSGTWTVQPGNTANTTAWLVTGTGGTFPVTDSGGSLTVDNNGTFAVQASQSGIWNIGTLTSITNAVTVSQATAANLNATVVGTGTFSVQASQAGTWTVQPGNTANSTAWLVTGTGGTFPVTDSGGSLTVDNNGTFAVQTTASATAGGLTQSKTDALVATATSVKASAGQVYGYHIANVSNADAYLHFYNIASGSVTVGSSTRTRSLYIPQGGVIDSAFGFGLTFSTAITIAATTTLTGSSAPSTGLLVMVDYV